MDCKLRKNKGKIQCKYKTQISKTKKLWRFDIIPLALMALFSYLLYQTNLLRAEVGWFENGDVIFWNTLYYSVMFGLISGYLIAKIIGKRLIH